MIPCTHTWAFGPSVLCLAASLVAFVPGCNSTRGVRTEPAVRTGPAERRAAPSPDDEASALCFAEAKPRNPTPDAFVAAGREFIRKARTVADPGYYVNVSACADGALALDPRNGAALELRGLVLLDQHRFREARALAEEGLRRDQDAPSLLGILADAALELGDADGAERAVQRMLDAKPNLTSYARAAHLRWLRGDPIFAKTLYGHAIRAGREARDREPFAWVLVQAALVFWHAGDYAGADAGFDAALSAVTDYVPAQVGKARVAIAQGRYADALLSRVMERHPSAEAAWLLGDARSLRGDAAGAEQAYVRLVTLGRGDRRNLAAFYASKKRDLAQAVALARAELEERPGPYSADVLAWALYRAGRPQEARQWADRALELGTPDARLLFHAGAVYIGSGDVAKGRELVVRALALNPSFDATESQEARHLVGS
jgi:tetratricopeptide (TPR) repeat protein